MLYTSTVIDYFLIGAGTTIVKAGVIACDLSDHLPIFMAIEQKCKVLKRRRLEQDIFRQKI